VDLGRLRGLSVLRSIAEARGAFGVVGARQPSSSLSMPSSLTKEICESSWLQGAGALVRRGGTGPSVHSLEKALWSSLQFGQWGGQGGPQLDTTFK